MRVERTGSGLGTTDVYVEVGVSDRELDRYTVYCSRLGTPDDEYDEEITVDARCPEHALDVAAGAIDVDFSPHLVPRLAEKQSRTAYVPHARLDRVRNYRTADWDNEA